MRNFAFGGLLMVLVWGCVSTPQETKPSVVLLPPYVSSDLSPGLAAKLVAAARRGVEDRYTVRTMRFLENGYDAAVRAVRYPERALVDEAGRWTVAEALGVTALGLIDAVPDETGEKLRLTFRVIDAATGDLLEVVSAESVEDLARGGSSPEAPEVGARLVPAAQWDEAWKAAPAFDAVALVWKEALDAARDSGDFGAANRWTDLLLDKLRAPDDPVWVEARQRIRTAVAQEGAWARTEKNVRTLMVALGTPSPSRREETLALYRYLDLVRRVSRDSEAAARIPVLEGFRRRFGLDLAEKLTQPDLVPVDGGTFSMGSSSGEPDEAPVHPVTLAPFLLGRTEVTQAFYESITGNNPALFNQAPEAGRLPVERVTWYDAIEFCNLLSLKLGYTPVYTITKRNPAKGYPIKGAEVVQDRTKNGFRLPTEAEWEWAARGGLSSQATRLAGGEDPAAVAWTGGTTGGPSPVATKAANELGFFDLSGNVWEWCSDWYGPYRRDAVTDPEGAALGILKVGRGGSWHAAPWMARVTARSFDNPGSRSNNLGFRLARSVPLN